MSSWVIEGATVLGPTGWSTDALHMVDGLVAADGLGSRRLDGQGCRLLPGIIDVHGDAFERELRPRASVSNPTAMALASCESQLIIHGITTFFWSITDGFEPGLRSRDHARELLAAVEGLQQIGRVDHRLHLRHEIANVVGHRELLDWIEQGRLDLLSLNDHVPPPGDERLTARYLAGLDRRSTMSNDEALAWLASIREGAADASAAQVEEIAVAARARGLVLASHDDDSMSKVDAHIGLGIGLAEFPTSVALARRYAAAGVPALYGCPNLIRGSSHVGAVSVREALAERVVGALCSDYHWPSLLRAPFLCAELELLPLAEAWRLVSRAPAEAVGLGGSHGTLAPGFRADAVLIEGDQGLASDVRAVWVAGELVSLADSWRLD